MKSIFFIIYLSLLFNILNAEENIANFQGKRTTIDVDYQLLVIGAGPHALSLLTKLIEPSKDYLEEHPANKNLFKISSNTGRVGAKYKLLPDHIFTQKDGIMLLDSILGIYPIMVISFCISML